MDYYVSVLRDRYAQFTGRARRTEFWMFVLVNFIVSLVLGFVLGMIHMTAISYLYSLAVFIPSIALTARRLHDIDKSGWWQLIGIIPIIGWIVMIVWCAKEGQPTDNKYGPNPKAMSAAASPAAPTASPTESPTASPAATPTN